VTSNGKRRDRIIQYSKRLLKEHKISGGVKFNILEDIPEHNGFGSGTQLALAVGTGISKLYNLGFSTEEIAEKFQRSRVSGLGTYAFKHGGFLIDGGHNINNRNVVPPIIFHTNFPEDWFFVVGVPEIHEGISGKKEINAFKDFKPPPTELVAKISRIVLMKMMPSIVEKDITIFGETVTSLDREFGGYWHEIQGGRYANSVIEEGVEWLLKSGAYGAGQSSWGPAFYGLANGLTQAKKITSKLSEFFEIKGINGYTYYTASNNNGAELEIRNN
jgi:beta-ribofuranosylaminobenzene 5'-phosphate synthase